MPREPVQEGYQALHAEESWGAMLKRTLKRLRFYIVSAVVIILLLLSVLQYLCYNFGTYGCSPDSLKTYNYPFGDDMLPRDMLLLEEDHYFWKTFMVTQTDVEGVKRGAALGYFYQVWGPFAYTTGFRDPFGHTIFASTPNALAIGSSKSIYRCDGKDEIYTLAEGSNWFLNRLRSLFGMFTATEYNIWRGSNLVAVSARVGFSSKNLLFHSPTNDDALAEASLVTRGFHGKYDEWVFHEHITHKQGVQLPSFVSATATALMAFHVEDTPKPRNAGLQGQAGAGYAEKPPLAVKKLASQVAQIPAAEEGKADMQVAKTQVAQIPPAAEATEAAQNLAREDEKTVKATEDAQTARDDAKTAKATEDAQTARDDAKTVKATAEVARTPATEVVQVPATAAKESENTVQNLATDVSHPSGRDDSQNLATTEVAQHSTTEVVQNTASTVSDEESVTVPPAKKSLRAHDAPL